jgi:hypothetical protein
MLITDCEYIGVQVEEELHLGGMRTTKGWEQLRCLHTKLDFNPLDFYLWGIPATLVCMHLLLTTKKHFTATLRMFVKLSAAVPPSLNGCSGR